MMLYTLIALNDTFPSRYIISIKVYFIDIRIYVADI